MPEEDGTLKDQWNILKTLGFVRKTSPEATVDNAKISKLDRSPADSPKKEESTDDESESPTTSQSKNKEESPKLVASDSVTHPLVRKLELSRPYGLFLTKVKDAPTTHRSRHSIYLTDLLHIAHGELKSTLQINFMVEWEWLKMNYEATGNEVRQCDLGLNSWVIFYIFRKSLS